MGHEGFHVCFKVVIFLAKPLEIGFLRDIILLKSMETSVSLEKDKGKQETNIKC